MLGELSAAHGTNMVSLCADTITLLTKTIRSSDLPLRPAALHALAHALDGSGGVGSGVQAEVIKNLKHVIAERGATAELRGACVACMAPLVRNVEGLWGTDTLDQLAPLATKYLDDPVPSVRAAASKALGRWEGRGRAGVDQLSTPFLISFSMLPPSLIIPSTTLSTRFPAPPSNRNAPHNSPSIFPITSLTLVNTSQLLHPSTHITSLDARPSFSQIPTPKTPHPPSDPPAYPRAISQPLAISQHARLGSLRSLRTIAREWRRCHEAQIWVLPNGEGSARLAQRRAQVSH